MPGRRLGVAVASVLALLSAVVVPAGAVAASPSILVSRVTTSNKLIALTFDIGSDVTNVPRILDVLADHGVKSTFFATGQAATNYPAALRTVVAHGHELGNHSYSHPSFPSLTNVQIADQLSRAAAAIRNTTGRAPRPYFRPPFGAYDARVLQAVGDAGYGHTIMWTIDTVDWRGRTSTVIRDTVLTRASPGAIVLMHVGAGAPGTPGALPGMIAGLKAAGYRLVTVSQLLGAAPSGQTVHVVKPGETLYRIAVNYGVTVAAIVAANRIANPSLIAAGQTLVIPTAAPPTTPPTGSPVRYTVKSGDTLYRIAVNHGVTVAAMMAANGITDPNLIRPGQVLVIPTSAPPNTPPPASPSHYTVKSGDTLYRIAVNHGVTVAAIMAANGITNPNVIRPGQVLTIPR
jgi:peptidoglycan/xylan/chitin deacetylase (PgdA/CDA1 family)/LysM repeat protein